MCGPLGAFTVDAPSICSCRQQKVSLELTGENAFTPEGDYRSPGVKANTNKQKIQPDHTIMNMIKKLHSQVFCYGFNGVATKWEMG